MDLQTKIDKLLDMQKQLLEGTPQTNELAYFAGIFHAEGNTRSTGGLRIGNTSKELIDWLTCKFGGSICLQKPGPLTTKQYYLWSLNSLESSILLQRLPPINEIVGECMHAYVAGLVDGDGTMYVKKVNKKGKMSLYPAVVFANTSSVLVRFIFDRYGGALSEQQPRLGRREKKSYWYLMLTGEKARVLIGDILPHLRIKQEKAHSILEECC